MASLARMAQVLTSLVQRPILVPIEQEDRQRAEVILALRIQCNLES